MKTSSKLMLVPGIVAKVQNWPTYFASYLGLLDKKPIVYKLRNGLAFEARAGTNDRSALNDVWIRESYNPHGFEIGESDTVVDVGAHIGFFSVGAALKASQGIVYSFEPVPDNFTLLENNVKRNNAANIITHRKAVASTSESRRMFLSAVNTGAHSLLPGEVPGAGIEVDSISLEDLLVSLELPKVDFLKMDCEGGEYEILFSSSDGVLNRIEKMAIECHNVDQSRNKSALKSFLEQKGFMVNEKKEGPRVGMLYAVKAS